MVAPGSSRCLFYIHTLLLHTLNCVHLLIAVAFQSLSNSSNRNQLASIQQNTELIRQSNEKQSRICLFLQFLHHFFIQALSSLILHSISFLQWHPAPLHSPCYPVGPWRSSIPIRCHLELLKYSAPQRRILQSENKRKILY